MNYLMYFHGKRIWIKTELSILKSDFNFNQYLINELTFNCLKSVLNLTLICSMLTLILLAIDNIDVR